MDLIQPKEIEIRGKTYVIGKFPAIEGRSVIAMYPGANLLQFKGDEKAMLAALRKVMTFVAAKLDDGREIRLNSETLINNHVPDWECLVMLEMEVLTYNCSFFPHGSVSTFLTALRNLDVAKLTEMLTPLLGKLSQAVKPVSTN